MKLEEIKNTPAGEGVGQSDPIGLLCAARAVGGCFVGDGSEPTVISRPPEPAGLAWGAILNKSLSQRERDFYNEQQVAENQRIEKVRTSAAKDDTTKEAQKQLRLFD